MRNIVLALVLANLAFAAWHSWFSAPPRGNRLPDAGVPTLTLVTELPEDLRALGEPSVEGAAVPVAAGTETTATEVAPNPAQMPPAPEGPGGAPVVAAEAPAELATAAAPNDVAAAAASAATNAAAAQAAAPTDPRCSSVGPFRELSQAATAAANLRAAGYMPLQRVAEGEIWIGYWVYIEAIATETEANDILAKVRADGITDSYVIPNSDSGNLVSLGVFSEISGVSRRREQVRALGYEPKVVDRTRRATVYWVDVVLAAGQTLDFDALQTPGRIVRLEQRSCTAATG